eukprot:COSAG02_NODE_9009_length_2362_cov_2.899249_3_plen_207_part_01
MSQFELAVNLGTAGVRHSLPDVCLKLSTYNYNWVRTRGRCPARERRMEACRGSGMAEAAAVSEICSTVGTDEASATHALAVSGGDVHKAISALLAADLPEDSADILHYNEKLARLEGSILSWEDTFSFDALGWLVLPVTLGADQLVKLRATDGSAGAALIGETLNGYIEELCGAGYRSNGPARCAGDHPTDGCEQLIGGNGVRTLDR